MMKSVFQTTGVFGALAASERGDETEERKQGGERGEEGSETPEHGVSLGSSTSNGSSSPFPTVSIFPVKPF